MRSGHRSARPSKSSAARLRHASESGTIGGGGRLDFTVIGDAVNTAARVEEATRETGDDVLITQATRALLSREPCELVEREVSLRGKAERVRLYAPDGVRPGVEGEERPARELA